VTKLILLAIAALGSISVLVLWILKRWWGKPEEKARLQGEVDELTTQMEGILDNKPVDWERYHKLNKRVWKLNRNIRRIRTTKRFFGGS